MAKPSPESWREAFMASPGPQSFKAALVLACKGLLMGAADVIPGVSGGTVALITGIYTELVQAIKSIDARTVASLLSLDLKNALAGVHVRFLLTLLLGIGTAIISLARLMNYLLNHQPVLTWRLFFGMIAASVLVVSRRVHGWRGLGGIGFLFGILVASFIVNLIPMTTPEALWFIFVCGLIAICAMILPGISGAFILLILGKYEFVTAALKNPFLASNLMIILTFCCGCVIGILAFSRVLNYLLRHHENTTLSFLTGLMAGSIQKIWPWKEIAAVRLEQGATHIVWGKNLLPAAWSDEILWAGALAVTGFIAVLVIERMSQGVGSKNR